MNKQIIFYATSNHGKFEEVARYIQAHAPEIALKQLECDLAEIQTEDQQKIAAYKAVQAFELCNAPLLLDDAAIYFEKYNNFPGTIAKQVSQGIGIEGILNLVKPGDKAYFKLTMIYANNDGNVYEFEGRCDGTIVHPRDIAAHPQLPYDAVFKPNGCEKTYAELRHTPEEFKYSYRMQALQKFLNWYKGN